MGVKGYEELIGLSIICNCIVNTNKEENFAKGGEIPGYIFFGFFF